MRVHFLNENLGGHATMHMHLRSALPAHPDIESSFFDVPSPGWLHRVLRRPVPGLARLDLDFTPLRDSLARSFVVARHLRTLADVDVLHVYTHNAALLSRPTMARIPTVVSLDATNRQNAYNLPYRRPTRFTATSLRPMAALEGRVYRRARAIVTHSQWAADSVMGYGVPAAAIEVIPFGIPVSPWVEPEGSDGLPRIVFIGNTMGRKGGWRLVELWRRRLADRSRLVLVTPEPVPAEPGLEVHHDIRSGDGRLDAVLRAADIFAMPGEVDAFGYALLEGMAAGLPAVAFRQGAVPEIVDDTVTGLVVPPGDIEAFGDALDRLLADASARRAMGRAGRDRVVGHFEAGHTTARLVDVLRSVR